MSSMSAKVCVFLDIYIFSYYIEPFFSCAHNIVGTLIAQHTGDAQ